MNPSTTTPLNEPEIDFSFFNDFSTPAVLPRLEPHEGDIFYDLLPQTQERAPEQPQRPQQPQPQRQ